MDIGLAFFLYRFGGAFLDMSLAGFLGIGLAELSGYRFGGAFWISAGWGFLDIGLAGLFGYRLCVAFWISALRGTPAKHNLFIALVLVCRRGGLPRQNRVGFLVYR